LLLAAGTNFIDVIPALFDQRPAEIPAKAAVALFSLTLSMLKYLLLLDV
jgi:hypothetical protein